MILKTKLFGHTYSFKDVKDVLAKANEVKSGDTLAGIAAESAAERIAAKHVLSQCVRIPEIYRCGGADVTDLRKKEQELNAISLIIREIHHGKKQPENIAAL
jgi:hypothetical protein